MVELPQRKLADQMMADAYARCARGEFPDAQTDTQLTPKRERRSKAAFLNGEGRT